MECALDLQIQTSECRLQFLVSSFEYEATLPLVLVTSKSKSLLSQI